jgi:DNA-binding beta-propeller fold protein YncE
MITIKLVTALGCVWLSVIPAFSQSTKLPDLGYKPVLDFFIPPSGANFGEVSGIALNSKGHIFVFNRGSKPLIEFDSNGKFIRTLGDGIFKSTHGLRIDSKDNIWITDIGLNIVLKLSPEGRVLMVLGRSNKAGEFLEQSYSSTLLNYDAPLFDQPTDVAFDSAGDIFVTDGYGNSRIVKFDKNGKFIKTWGRKGNAPGEFNLPHSIAFDSKDLMYIADRENDRIQIFDAEGKVIKEWTHVGDPWAIVITPDQFLYMADGKNERVLKMNLNGEILGVLGEPGKGAGQFDFAHSIAVSSKDEIYIGEVLNWRVQKFVKK